MSEDDVRKKYERLQQAVREIVPYVTATIAENNAFPSKSRPDWVEVHKGRAASSHRQLQGLLKLANEEE